jgi:hypothetical protein
MKFRLSGSTTVEECPQSLAETLSGSGSGACQMRNLLLRRISSTQVRHGSISQKRTHWVTKVTRGRRWMSYSNHRRARYNPLSNFVETHVARRSLIAALPLSSMRKFYVVPRRPAKHRLRTIVHGPVCLKKTRP